MNAAGSLRRAVIAVTGSAVIVAAFAFSFIYAQATPAAHELPVGLEGSRAAVDRVTHDIHASTGDAFDVHGYASEPDARQAIEQRDIYAVLVLSETKPKLLTAPAAGVSAETVIERRLPRAAGVPATLPVQIAAVKPLVKGDEQGQAINLLVLPLMIFSVVVPILLAAVAAALTVRVRLALIAGFALLAGVGATLVANVWLDSVPGSFVGEAAIAALTVLAAASATLAFIALLGPAGGGVGLLLFLVIGNVASGAFVVDELMPGFWRAVGPWLPPGALAESLRNIAYFDHRDLGRPLLVLIAFALVATAVNLVLGGRRPAPQGDPAGPTPDAGPA